MDGANVTSCPKDLAQLGRQQCGGQFQMPHVRFQTTACSLSHCRTRYTNSERVLVNPLSIRTKHCLLPSSFHSPLKHWVLHIKVGQGNCQGTVSSSTSSTVVVIDSSC